MSFALSPAERSALRARAHALNPVVSISSNGLTAAVLKEIDLALAHHELIKVRVYGDERALRVQYLEEICSQTGAAPVQHIGKLLVVFRPNPDSETNATKRPQRAARSAPRRSKRSFQE